ncbi:MAG: DEAD/DEAH box helicase family protein [Merismopedia sp. SIO2A8]|nr:DEAD/DEAH box helicase family protein [Merismopedia sp. SIO2A8]
MADSLKHYDWKIQYASDSSNPVADFYIPALERSIQYDRKSGFFNSAILSQVASGLGAMLHNADMMQGQMRLIMGCQLSKADLEAIQNGYALRDTVAANLEVSLQPPENFAQLKRLEILSWLIQSGCLDIKIAIPLKQDRTPLAPDAAIDINHIYHEKVCIFTDAEGHQLATNGSNNASSSGWRFNIESFHVFCSWENQRELARVQEEVVRFEQLWSDIMPNVRVFDVPDAVRRKLLRYAPQQRPAWSPQDELNHRPLTPEERQKFDPIAPSDSPKEPPSSDTTPEENAPDSPDPNSITPDEIEAERQCFEAIATIHTHPGCLSACLNSIPIQPWPHQLKILKRVAADFPRSFLIADEVGLGKTIETGLILRYLLMSKKAQRILVLAPASVQPQWQDELREKFNLHFWSYTQGDFRDPYGTTQPPTANPWNTKDLVLASSHLVRRQERMHELLDAEPWDLVVLDEAHHARRRSPQARQDTPNRLLTLLERLRERTQSLILLSATGVIKNDSQAA